MEEKILETESKYDYETIKKFNKFHMNNQFGGKVVTVLAIFLVLFSIFAVESDISFRIMTAIIAIVWFVEILALPHYQAKKAIKSSKINSESIVKTEFYNTKIKLTTIKDGEDIGNTIVKYDDFYKVYDTKDAMYLYISANQAFICLKANMKGDYPKVSELCKEKLGKKYKLKK